MSSDRTGRPRSSGSLIDPIRLLKERRKRGMNQEQFSDFTGISLRRIGELERSLWAFVQPRTVRKLSERLGLDPSEFLREASPPLLINDQEDLVAENIRIVEAAQEYLYVTGSRSRDADYLARIAEQVRTKQSLIHRRILLGPPRTTEMVDHIVDLLAMGDPRRRHARRIQALGIAICSDHQNYPLEACICMNEHRGLLVLPSIVSPWAYDTAVVFDNAAVITGWKRWVDTMFLTGTQINLRSQIEAP